MEDDADGADRISKQPSLPPTAEGEAVPRREVSGGLEGYTPWIWLMSAGLMGVASVRRRRVCGGREGEMECVWSLSWLVSWCLIGCVREWVGKETRGKNEILTKAHPLALHTSNTPML